MSLVWISRHLPAGIFDPPGHGSIMRTIPHIDAILVMDIVKYDYCGTGREPIHRGFSRDKDRVSGYFSVVL